MVIVTLLTRVASCLGRVTLRAQPLRDRRKVCGKPCRVQIRIARCGTRGAIDPMTVRAIRQLRQQQMRTVRELRESAWLNGAIAGSPVNRKRLKIVSLNTVAGST